MSARTSGSKKIESRWSRFAEESSYLRHYFWKYRKSIFVGLAALVVVDTLEILPPIFLKESVDVAIQKRPLRIIACMALAYLVVALLQGVCRYLWRVYLLGASMKASRDLRNRYARHLFGLSVSFFERRRIGDLMSLATNDVEAVRMALGNGLLVFADALFYFLTVPIAMILLSPRLTWIAFIPLPIIPYIVFRNEREIHERFEKVQECFSELSALTQEGLNGIRVVKAFAKEDVQNRRFSEVGDEFIRLNLKLSRVNSAFGPTLDFTMSLGLVLLLYFGGRDLIFGGALTLGTFVAFQRYIQKMVWPMAGFGMSISFFQRACSSSGRLKEIFEIQSDVPESLNPKLPALATLSGRWKSSGAVEFKNLNFNFPGTDKLVLDGISLSIEPGERIAFVGMVGAGKSALLSLLPRLYPVGRGMLLLDGVDVNDWPIRELRRQVGYVSQDVFLFSENVIENVAFGLHEWVERSGTSIPVEDAPIEEATQLASVHEEILGLSASYRTRLGERGVNLSGGQKQRLTIARALAKQPAVLVLDDALSSVDMQTEEKILKGLRSRPGRNTEIIAAHRISTIRDADRIVVLDGGTIRQIGKHADLARDRRGLYRKFYEQQQLWEELENFSELLDKNQGLNEEKPA